MYARPTHNLQQIKALIRAQGPRAFTSMAIACGRRELTMTVQEMIDMILARNDSTCYKTMPSQMHPDQMQDVYHWPTPFGQIAYVKFSLGVRGKVVVSFKEK